MNTPKVRYFG